MADLASMITATANSLQMDPIDLATIISYETAGTFDPMKRGPTTQWGQHQGLIQFGEPQARQYGVDWNDPVGSQLGPDGAVARYFRQNGWQPGMGILDAYSIVNAGGPGLYNRTDANNGGAPGTVQDKVEQQFGPHRDKAQTLLGAALTPNGNQLSFGDAVPQTSDLAGMFGGPVALPFDTGAPAAPQPNLGQALAQRSEKGRAREDRGERQRALAAAIKY